MNPKNKYAGWEKELLDFGDTKPISPPSQMSEEIRFTVRQELTYSIWRVFTKYIAIQTSVASLTLFLCPQFEIGFTEHDYLAGLIQHNEGVGFMIICGAFFLSSGAFLATFFLNTPELRTIEKSEFIYFPTATAVALLLFYFMGADLNWTLSLPWFVGGILGGILGFNLAKKIRLQLATD